MIHVIHKMIQGIQLIEIHQKMIQDIRQIKTLQGMTQEMTHDTILKTDHVILHVMILVIRTIIHDILKKHQDTTKNIIHQQHYPHSHSPHYPRYPDPEPTELPPRRYPATNYPETETLSTHPPTPNPTRHHHPVHTTPKIITHHPRHRDPSKHKPNDYPEKSKPDGCNTDYDAVTIIRGELYIFKDKYLWRNNDKGLYAGLPYEISRVWRDLSKDFKRIDAVYEYKEQKIVFFIGKQYYVFNSHILEKGYSKLLTNLGLPDTLDKIDAVLVWGWNNKTYFYSGTLYWRFDEDTGKVELDYPRDMSIWNGIGYIDVAFQYLNDME